MKSVMRTSLTLIVFLVFSLGLASTGVFATTSTKNFNPSRNFTIKSISTWQQKKGLRIVLSEHCPKETLRRTLRFYPPVYVYWYSSRIEDRVVYLDGKFKPGQQYRVIIPPDTECAGKTYVPTVTTFRMPDLEPQIGFADDGTVIERDSRQLLSLKVLNSERLLFRALRLSPAHLVVLGPKTLKLSWADLVKTLQEKEPAIARAVELYPELRRFYRPLFKEQEVFFPQVKKNKFELFSMPLTFRKDKHKGAIEVLSLLGWWQGRALASKTRLIAITDTSISYKLSRQDLFLWLTSLRTGQPVPGAVVLAITDRGYGVVLGQSDSDGLLRVALDKKIRHIPLLVPEKKAGGYRGYLKKLMGLLRGQKQKKALPKALMRPLEPSALRYLVVQTDTDVSFIKVDRAGNIRPDWVVQTSSVRSVPRALKGYVFTDRGIYRPGEKLYFKATVREFKDRDIIVPKDLKIALTIVDSKGNEIYKRQALSLTEFGTFSDEFRIPAYAPLGRYTITVSMGPTKASRSFQVQEFRRPRHYVEIGFKHIKQKSTEYVNIEKEIDLLECTLSGRYYAGGPVKHGKVRWKIYLAPTKYPRKDYPEYEFGNFLAPRTELLESGESVLDEQGNIRVTIPMNRDVVSGVYAIEAVATVVDIDGRAYTESAVFQSPPEYLVGISKGPREVNTGQRQLLKIIVLDRQHRPVSSGRIEVEIMKRSYTYVRKRNEQGDLYWQWKEVWKRDSKAVLPIKQGRAVFDFDFAWSGDYLLRFIYTTEDGRAFVSSVKYTVSGGYYYTRGKDKKRNFEKFPMVSERKEYRPGETIRLYINPPRKVASVLMTIERDRVIEARVIKIRPSQRYIELKASEEFIPNVYISLLATTGRTEFPSYANEFDRGAPSLFYGVVNVEVKKDTEKLKIAINEDEPALKARPADEVVLNIKVTDSKDRGVVSELAVAVVDEAVLALTGYRTPDLSSLRRFNLPLSVFTGDLRPLILRQSPFKIIRPTEVTGGGGLAKLPGEVTGKLRRNFRPVAYFNPSVKTSKDGTAVVRFRVPDTMTKYRVFVVACDRGSRFGSIQRALLVTKDFYIQPGMPRFFTRGDRFKFTLSAFNRTYGPGNATIKVTSGRALSLNPQTEAIVIGPGDRGTFLIQGRATGQGQTKVLFKATLDGFEDLVELKVPVSSGYLLWDDVVFGIMKDTGRIRYEFPRGTKAIDWSALGPEDIRVLLTVSGSPFIRLQKPLRYLLKYPYGCVEQTSSGVLPLAALRALIKRGLIPEITIEETDKFLKKGIARLLSMQTPSGGFSYWPGRLSPHPWGSIYATVALSYAKLAGADVPEKKLNKALTYLKNEITDKTNLDNTFKGFAAYVLALNKQLRRPLFASLFREFNLMSREGAMMLLLAGYETGYLPRDELRALARLILQKRWKMRSVDVFYARYREPAISVLLGAAVLKDDLIVRRKVKMLLAGLNRQGRWTSTSDTGWALIALGKYFEGLSFKDRTIHLTVKGPDGLTKRVNFRTTESATLEIPGRAFLKRPVVELKANGEVLYMLSLRFPRVDFGTKGYYRGFRVEKEIKNASGSGEIRVGDIVKVTLTIDVDVEAPRFIVIDDPLPAGLVAINTAIKTEEVVPYEHKTQWNYWDPLTDTYKLVPSYFEIRDDRVLVFRDRAWKGTYRYSYYARAVCEGEFVMPSTKVQLMYEPDVVGITPVKRIVIMPQQQ